MAMSPYPSKKLKPDANKQKLDKVGKPSPKIEWIPARVVPKRKTSTKKY